MEHQLLRDVAKVHVGHGDVALQLGIGDGSVRLVGVLPCPVAGMLRGLGDAAVFVDLRVDQPDVAVVRLRLLVHQLEDALRARQRHDDGVDLVGDLADGHVEGAGQEHEAHQAAKGQHIAAGQHAQRAAHDGQNGILDIAQVVVDGSHHVGQGSGGTGVAVQLLVELVELLLAGFLVGEDLDHLLAVDHFLHVAVQHTERLLLADKVSGGLPCHLHGDEDDAGDGKEHHDGQQPGGLEHSHKDHHNGHQRGGALGNGLGDHLPQSIDVAGVAGHDVTCGVGVKIPQRKGLHMGEHFVPDVLLGSLADLDHQEHKQEGRNHAHGKDAGKLAEIPEQGCKIRGAVLNHRQDIAVHQGAEGAAAGGLGDGVGDDAQQHHAQSGKIGLHVAKQPQEGFPGVFGFAAVAAHSDRRHYSSPPFCWE